MVRMTSCGHLKPASDPVRETVALAAFNKRKNGRGLDSGRKVFWAPVKAIGVVHPGKRHRGIAFDEVIHEKEH